MAEDANKFVAVDKDAFKDMELEVKVEVPEYDGKDPEPLDIKKATKEREESIHGVTGLQYHIVQQADGNWKGYTYKTDPKEEPAVHVVRDYDPQVVLQMLLTHQ